MRNLQLRCLKVALYFTPKGRSVTLRATNHNAFKTIRDQQTL
jgi:hypothetical protein